MDKKMIVHIYFSYLKILGRVGKSQRKLAVPTVTMVGTLRFAHSTPLTQPVTKIIPQWLNLGWRCVVCHITIWTDKVNSHLIFSVGIHLCCLDNTFLKRY